MGQMPFVLPNQQNQSTEGIAWQNTITIQMTKYQKEVKNITAQH